MVLIISLLNRLKMQALKTTLRRSVVKIARNFIPCGQTQKRNTHKNNVMDMTPFSA